MTATVLTFPPDAARRRQSPPPRPAKIIRPWPRRTPRPAPCNPSRDPGDDLLAEPLPPDACTPAEDELEQACRELDAAMTRHAHLLERAKRIPARTTEHPEQHQENEQ